MTQGDDRILELLEDTGLILSPAVLSRNLDYTRNYVSDRLKKLREAGLVDRVDPGYYTITELGRDYIHGRASQADIPDDIG